MSTFVVENEYRKDILELNAEQALAINYGKPEDLLQMVSGLGMIGDIPELFSANKPFAISISRDGFHISESVLNTLVNDIEATALVCSMSDIFFNGKNFEFMVKDLMLAAFEHEISFIRLLITKKDGVVLKFDVAMNQKTNNKEQEASRICSVLEIEITKLLKDIPADKSMLELYNGEITATVENLNAEYEDNLYYLINTSDVENTRMIIIEN